MLRSHTHTHEHKHIYIIHTHTRARACTDANTSFCEIITVTMIALDDKLD